MARSTRIRNLYTTGSCRASLASPPTRRGSRTAGFIRLAHFSFDKLFLLGLSLMFYILGT